jgi:IMP dehydrogenase/GMP reductase
MSEITFSDVLIEPRYSEIMSRSHVNLNSDLGKFKLQLPVISANMKHITGAKMANIMYLTGGLGILHRFNTIDSAIEEFQDAMTHISYGEEKCREIENPDYSPRVYSEKDYYNLGVSIGVQESDKERFNRLYEYGARLFCIDVAHGHHLHMKNMLTWIKKKSVVDNNIVIIAGNVATKQGAFDLHSWGADIIKVGIGPGAVCQTRKNTGVGVPQLHALREIREAIVQRNLDLKIISDGGIKSTGDVVKAMKYADAVMIGSFIAGTSETPGDVYEDSKGRFYKVYGGSASAENKILSGKENKFVEGVMTTVPFKGHVKYILKRIHENAQSAFSYVGARNMTEFKEKAKFRVISGSGKSESKL